MLPYSGQQRCNFKGVDRIFSRAYQLVVDDRQGLSMGQATVGHEAADLPMANLMSLQQKLDKETFIRNSNEDRNCFSFGFKTAFRSWSH